MLPTPHPLHPLGRMPCAPHTLHPTPTLHDDMCPTHPPTSPIPRTGGGGWRLNTSGANARARDRALGPAGGMLLLSGPGLSSSSSRPGSGRPGVGVGGGGGVVSRVSVVDIVTAVNLAALFPSTLVGQLPSQLQVRGRAG